MDADFSWLQEYLGDRDMSLGLGGFVKANLMEVMMTAVATGRSIKICERICVFLWYFLLSGWGKCSDTC